MWRSTATLFASYRPSGITDRSPVRPNPIGTSIVKLESVEGNMLLVRGLDCLDGTPLLDLKPDRTLFKPIAPPQAGDYQTDENTSTAHYCQKA